MDRAKMGLENRLTAFSIFLTEYLENVNTTINHIVGYIIKLTTFRHFYNVNDEIVKLMILELLELCDRLRGKVVL